MSCVNDSDLLPLCVFLPAASSLVSYAAGHQYDSPPESPLDGTFQPCEYRLDLAPSLFLLRRKGAFVDVVVKSSSSDQFAHQVVLAAGSPYLRRLLQSNDAVSEEVVAGKLMKCLDLTSYSERVVTGCVKTILSMILFRI